METTRVCKKCGKEKDLAGEFYHSSGENYHWSCKSCFKSSVSKRRIEKPDTFASPSYSSKVCNRCKEEKPLEQYYRQQTGDGYRGMCKVCCNTYSKDYKVRTDRTLLTLDQRLRNRYGITAEEYYEMLQEQNNGCAICGKIPAALDRILSVDHNHDTGKVRSLLCQKCNTAIGMFDEDRERLLRAAEYLRRHNG